MKKIIIMLAVCVLVSCTQNTGKIRSLTFAVYPSDDISQTLKYTQNISKYLSKELKIEVNYIQASDYTAVIEAMKSNKCQIALLGSFSYILAAQNAGAEAIIATGTRDGKYFSYRSILITSPSTGLRNMDDVKKKASGLKLAFTDPASTSGHLLPREYLTSIGLNPDNSFASVTFSSSHAASLLTTRSKQVDLAATNTTSLIRLLSIGKMDSSEIKVLWKSEPILFDAFCVKSSLPTELKEQIRQAFINMPVKAPEVFHHYIDYTFAGDPLKDSLLFKSVSDSSYDGIRKIARKIKSLNIK